LSGIYPESQPNVKKKCINNRRLEVENAIMKYGISFIEGVATIGAIGRAMPEGYTAIFFDLVTSPEWVPGMKIMLDFNELELKHQSSDDLQEMSRAIGRYRKKLGLGRCAIVTSDPTEFGVGRMLQVWMECDTDLQIRVFFSIDKANQWLNGNTVLDFSEKSVV
jgi:hypothetical protein